MLEDKLKTELPILVREAQESDVAFIFNSWLKSNRSCPFANGVDNTIYFSGQHELIERLLKTCTVKIACNLESPDQIFGYLVYEKIDGIYTFHYAYTKEDFRGLGVARELLRSVDGFDFKTLSIITHINGRHMPRIADRYNMVYHPYILINYKGGSK